MLGLGGGQVLGQLLHQSQQLVLRGAGGVVGVSGVKLGRQLLKRYLAGFQVLKQDLRWGRPGGPHGGFGERIGGQYDGHRNGPAAVGKAAVDKCRVGIAEEVARIKVAAAGLGRGLHDGHELGRVAAPAFSDDHPIIAPLELAQGRL